MILEPLKLAPHLRSLPDLKEHEVTAAQLATNGIEAAGVPSLYQSDHLGRVIAVRQGEAFLAGPLRGVTDSVESPLLILRIGQFTTAVHPSHPVTVAPDGYRLTITAQPKTVTPAPPQTT